MKGMQVFFFFSKDMQYHLMIGTEGSEEGSTPLPLYSFTFIFSFRLLAFSPPSTFIYLLDVGLLLAFIKQPATNLSPVDWICIPPYSISLKVLTNWKTGFSH